MIKPTLRFCIIKLPSQKDSLYFIFLNIAKSKLSIKWQMAVITLKLLKDTDEFCLVIIVLLIVNSRIILRHHSRLEEFILI